MNNHPLPWNNVRHALGHSLTDANGGLVAEAMTEAEVDAILAVTNKVPALVEACDAMAVACEREFITAETEDQTLDPFKRCHDTDSVWSRAHGPCAITFGHIRALRTALAAFKTESRDNCRCGMGEQCGPNNCDFAP
jgi:hypothetical protein